MSIDALNSLYIAGSALTAQRLRMDVISSNLANVETTVTPQGGPYHRQMVVFTPRPLDTSQDAGSLGDGVQVSAIVQDPSPPKELYQPGNPQADPNGFVAYPNVDLTTEMVDLMAASRAYEANASVIQTTTTLVDRTLQLGSA
jgi:flagellar basal-body rod protein FlgC